MTCRVDVCDREANGARGYCNSHYRWAWGRDFQVEPTHEIGEHKRSQELLIEEGVMVCHDCGDEKALGEFPEDKSSPNGRGYRCKECHRDYASMRSRKRRDRIKQVKSYVSCLRCGCDDWRLLEFHHPEPEDKQFSIGARMESVGWLDLLHEIEKCDVLCRNCHHLVEHYDATY